MSNKLDLNGLNRPQLSAILNPPNIPLQILAGPGSGKTKVLTMRIAHLILQHSLPASSICAVTFTNKAAKEMKERLAILIGKQRVELVKMGTFHSLCAQFLRRNASLVGIQSNFTVCDSDESKKTVATLLKSYKTLLADKDIALKEGTVLSLISQFKAKGLNPDDVMNLLDSSETSSKVARDIDRIVAEVYLKYEAYLRRSNSLDFDDLLIFGVMLFRENKDAVAWCRHVFVDEFQDTNIIQYDLMKCLAAVHGCVTIVGDPDQSIYGWRSAEVANLTKMRQDFTGTQQILLEENYRSTGAILSSSIAIISQDKSRPVKSLYTAHAMGITPVIRTCEDEHAEAAFIASEIRRVVANMGGVLKWGDFAILLRFNALSRAIESALQKSGIPSKILGGHKFFERLEIKDLLSYLQVVDNPDFEPAFARAVNVPSRGIGEKTLAEITARATKTKLPSLTVVERINEGKMPDIKPPVSRKLGSFATTIKVLRELAAEGTSPADLLRKLLTLIGYQEFLQKTQPDWETRWENVQELITFATDVDSDFDVDGTDAGSAQRDTPLRAFLQASMLSSQGDNSKDETSSVTISTCHAAKGLEWPVVFVPAVEQGTFPFYRTESVEEERRLLYVACTRAQGMLYISHASKRKFGGETKTKELSEFVSVVLKQDQVFTSTNPEFSPASRAILSQVLRKPAPVESQVTQQVNEFNRTIRHSAPAQIEDSYLTHADAGVGLLPIQGASFQTGSGQSIRLGQHSSSELVPSLPKPLASASTSNLPYKLHPLCHALPKQSTVSQTPSASVKHTAQLPPSIPIPAAVAPSSLAIATIAATSQTVAAAPLLHPGVKRRLGMGRGGGGYSNKKFKPPC